MDDCYGQTKLVKKDIRLIDVKGDGNCFYRVCALKLFRDEEKYIIVKNAALKFLTRNRETFFDDLPKDYFNSLVNYHSLKDTWADHIMISCVALAFDKKIIIQSKLYKNEVVYLEEINDHNPIVLKHDNGIHFKLVQDDNNLPISSLEIQETQSLITRKRHEKMKQKIKEDIGKYKLNLFENQESDYVDYYGNSLSSRYNDAYLYHSKSIMPEYITCKDQSNINNWKKKISKYRVIDIPLNEFSRSKLLHKSSEDDLEYYIPLKSEENKLFEIAHINGKRHLSRDKSITKLYSMGIKYTQCYEKLSKYIKNCFNCTKSAPPQEKSKKYKPINTSRPREIIQFDSVYLNKKLFGRSFLITAIDHFSKFGWIFEVDKINSFNASNCLKNVYNDCEMQIESVHTDNGPEFKKFFEQFLKEKNINRRLGAPYKPTSQGCIERFNRTVQENLLKAFKNSTKEDPFILCNEIILFLEDYNYTFNHSTTKMIPFKLFKEKSEEKLNEIQESRNELLMNIPYWEKLLLSKKNL